MTPAREPRPLPADAGGLVARFSDDVQEVMLGLRERVLGVAPLAHELIADVGYTVSLLYGAGAGTKDAFVYVTGFANHANLGFPHGASLPDPAGVLEGDGAQMRHAKFRTLADLGASWLEEYLEAALAQAGLHAHVGDGATTVRTRAPTRASR